jgi:hypothetical protein
MRVVVQSVPRRFAGGFIALRVKAALAVLGHTEYDGAMNVACYECTKTSRPKRGVNAAPPSGSGRSVSNPHPGTYLCGRP